MSEISFIDRIQFDGPHLDNTKKLYNFVEDTFNFGARSVYYIKTEIQDKMFIEEIKHENKEKFDEVLEIALKISVLISLFPLTMALLSVKVYFRLTHTFTLETGVANPKIPPLKVAETKVAETNENDSGSKINKISDPVADHYENLSPEEAINSTTAIDKKFTSHSIQIQRDAHEDAKNFLKKLLPKVGAGIEIISPPDLACPKVIDVSISNDLDPTVFCWMNTNSVGDDIQTDGKRTDNIIVVYGVASQFNGCESPSRATVPPGQAVPVYEGDGTQGPEAQLQFGKHQVELINCGGNKAFNGLCYVLDDATRTAVEHGYFTPSKDEAEKVIQQLTEKGKNIEYLCVGNIPTDGQKPVYLILVAAPAFGMYTKNNTVTGKNREEIEFLCALHGFRAQYQQCINLAKREGKEVIFKPAAVGLGVFKNDPKVVVKALYQASKEFETELRNNKVSVRFQVRGAGAAKFIADTLKLKQFP